MTFVRNALAAGAVATTLAFAAPAQAGLSLGSATSSVVDIGIFPSAVLAHGAVLTLMAGAYSIVYDVTASGFNSLAPITWTASISDATNATIYSKVVTQDNTTTHVSEVFTVTPAQASTALTFKVFAVGPANPGTLTFTNSSVAPVPGPIAGAGLPVVLGLMGYGAWRRRKAAAA